MEQVQRKKLYGRKRAENCVTKRRLPAEGYWCDSEEECLESYAENHGISVEDARKMIKK